MQGDPGIQALLGLLRSGAMRALINAQLPPDAELVLVERQNAARALFDAHERGADMAELYALGERLLQLSMEPVGSSATQ